MAEAILPQLGWQERARVDPLAKYKCIPKKDRKAIIIGFTFSVLHNLYVGLVYFMLV